MSLPGQRVQPDRYTIIPRTLCFLLHEDDILLIRIPEDRGEWGGLYNGVGGHIEQGEDPLTAARREILEETGLSPDRLRVCGIVMIDTGVYPGIGLFVFCGQVREKGVNRSSEGNTYWLPHDSITEYPIVEDLPLLLPKALEHYAAGTVFIAKYSYDGEGNLRIQFA